MSLRQDNLRKKWLACLKCGRRIWTDRCHRFCNKCGERNVRQGPQKRTYRVSEQAGGEDMRFLLSESTRAGWSNL